MRQVAVLLALVGMVSQMTACATLFAGDEREIDFQSEPSGATVRVDGRPMGKTPIRLDIDNDSDKTITIEKEGYKPGTMELETNIGPQWVVLDSLGCLITLCISVAVDGITGAWWEFDKDSVFIRLEKTSSSMIREYRDRHGPQAKLDWRKRSD